jgi:hypothetical protein
MDNQDFTVLIHSASQDRPFHVPDDYARVDLWGKEFNKPLFGNYQKKPTTRDYLKALSSKISFKVNEMIIKPKRGLGGGTGTWVHPLIASHYASWLNADFALLVNETFLKVSEGDADLGADLILRDHNKERVERAKKRLLVCDANKQVADLAIAHGVNPGVLHNDRYRGLYRKTAAQLRQEGGVKGKGTPLDVLSARDNGMNWLANQMSVEADDPNLLFDFANDIRESYQKRVGKPLEPIFETRSIRPAQAKSIAFGNNQLELAV